MSEEYKGYKIESDKKFSMKVVKPIGKGSVHKPLTGLYTSALEARKAIDMFMAKLEKEMEKQEAKSPSKSKKATAEDSAEAPLEFAGAQK